MSDSRVGGYPMGVTDATIERCYGGTREPRFGKSACDCSSCIADKGGTCERVAMRDIASRIRKLRGEGE